MRILLALTDAFRARAADMHRTIEAATELDFLQSRARFSESIDGIEPALSADGAFELQAARHPLVKHAVPVTIKVIPPATVLLITGPNTGGKTVALKTAGLVALMAQSGLRIPAADGSRVPVFRSLFADIGDEHPGLCREPPRTLRISGHGGLKLQSVGRLRCGFCSR